jgi:hypothetical protein
METWEVTGGDVGKWESGKVATFMPFLLSHLYTSYSLLLFIKVDGASAEPALRIS